MQSDIQRTLLRDVRLWLSAVSSDMEAYWADADPGKDAEIFLVRDGARHSVYVQVGANFASVNVMHHSTACLGHGIRQGVFEALTQGAPRRPVWEKVGPDLTQALAAHEDVYEPSRGPGIVLRQEFRMMLAGALEAFADLPDGPWTPVANGGPGAEGADEDALWFVDGAGRPHPLTLSTHPNALAEILSDGARLGLVPREAGADGVAARLREALSEDAVPHVR